MTGAVVGLVGLLVLLLLLFLYISPCLWFKFKSEQRDQDLVTRQELMHSIPPPVEVATDPVTSQRPGMRPGQVNIFDPSARIRGFCDSLRETPRLFDPMPRKRGRLLVSEAATNSEADRTIVNSVNSLLEKDDVPALRCYMFDMNPVVDRFANDIPDEGEPDWECRRVKIVSNRILLDGNKSIATIEGKRPGVAGDFPSGHVPQSTRALYEENRNFRSAIQQEYKYMRTRKHPWGLVCFLTFWVILWDDQPGCLSMSEALPHTSPDPTLIMVLLFVVHQNHAHLTAASLNSSTPSTGPSTKSPTNPRTNPPFARVTRSSVAKAVGGASTQTGSASGGLLTRRRSADPLTTPLLSSDHLSTSPDSPLSSLTWEALGLKGGYLGVGRSGAVCLGEVDNRKAAVKVVDLDARNAHQLVEELLAEYLAYQRLRELWGSCVPACLAYGACVDRSCHVLVTEVIEGAPLNVSTLSIELRQQVVQALEKVHRLGVRHGDLTPDNILVRGAEVFLIDFGFSKIDGAEEEMLEEADELKRTLGLLGDTT